MVLVGFALGRCWSDAVVTGNPVCFALLAQLFTLIFMLPANNAVAQSLDGFFTLSGVVLIYALSRKYYRPTRLDTHTVPRLKKRWR